MIKRILTAWPAGRRGRLALLAGGLGLLALGAGAAINGVPALGAQAADTLRGVVGDQAVAALETVVYQVQDTAQQWVYRLGGARPAAPWSAATAVALAPATPLPAASPTRPALLPTARAATPASASALSAPVGPLPPTAAAAPTGTPGPAASPAWSPAPITGLGQLPGEGQWTPYLRDGAGQVVAYRTFLQPDPARPYAVAALVAFNLDRVRLHFVLGSSEPRSPVALDRPGTIPANDLLAGVLLATFNGGFKARQGHYGAMINGLVVLPPRPDLATVGLYADGQVRLGAWGTDIVDTPNLLSWRQNGPLLIHQGQINPHTAEAAPWDWGYTLDGGTAVWRSGLGLSADHRTLYYVAGDSLVTAALAQSLAATGAAEAMQLDINKAWVHFDAIQPGARGLLAAPLLDTMADGVGRYLKPSTRDFFYITALS